MRTSGPGEARQKPPGSVIRGRGYRSAPGRKRGPAMKRIVTWAALAAAAGVAVALAAGKDDIRKFRRMRSM
jgi:hypothetical protein